ncbi:UvrD-helicase domain-containing protein [Aeromonas rivipollensis]|uniref:UvrD-helicase domain-containing protein n=1 Tax=Aeromonas rivipollensis TaxID=948519 RepID=UPI0038D12F27
MTNKWQPSLGIEPTQELMEIIECDHSISVLAGAGSGKTELLAQKANYLLETGKCTWPSKMLCLSYKKEAQENIKARVEKRCGQKSARFDSYTFDAFCKSIVDRFKGALPNNRRPHDNYDLVFNVKECNNKNKISFDLIRTLALEILHIRPDISDLFSLAYSHVFIDEFQDTRSDQYQLLQYLFNKENIKLVAVGDINQSIMLWAKASPTAFKDFENDFNPEKKLLIKNFRSSKEIQEVLGCFIYFVQQDFDIPPIKESRDNCSIHRFNNEISEANYLACKISEFIKSGIEEKEICVLTKQLSAQYTEKLRDILTTKGIRNLEMSELQDFLREPLGEIFSSLFMLYTSKSPLNYTKICNIYLSLHRVERDNDKEAKLINQLSEVISCNRIKLNNTPSADTLLSCIKDTLNHFGKGKIIGRWNQYKSHAFLDKVWNKLEDHLRHTISVTNSLTEAALMFQAENAIQIMNIHKSKGLEYKVVIFLGLEDEAFWSYKKEKFENDCALYVALSRAKEKIFITTAKRREHRVTQQYDNRFSTYVNLMPVYEFLTHKCKFQCIEHD